MHLQKSHYTFFSIALLVVFSIVFYFSFFADFNSNKNIQKIKDIIPLAWKGEANQASNIVLTPEEKKYAEFSFSEKLNRELALNAIAAKDTILMSGENILNALIKKGASVPPDMAERMKRDAMTSEDMQTIDIYFTQILSEEDNFYIELAQYHNFKEFKRAFDARSKTTGLFYGNDLLKEPRAYRDATLSDIRGLLESGASLPDDALKHIVNAGHLDLAIGLREAGFNMNIDYVDAFTSKNTIEIQVENIVINPYAGSVEDHTKTVKKLIDLGVPLSFKEGTRDALDIALYGAYNHEPDEAEKLLNLAIELNKAGLNLEKSHIELLEMIKTKYPTLHSQYYGNFK